MPVPSLTGELRKLRNSCLYLSLS